MSNFSENLKELLFENNLSGRELAKRINSAPSLISTYILGKYMPTINKLIKLADYFNCSCDYLLGIIDEDKVKNFKLNVNYNNKTFIERYNLAKNDKTDYAIAKQLNINSGVIANWKAGHAPNVETLINLADLLGTSVDYLIGRSDIN